MPMKIFTTSVIIFTTVFFSTQIFADASCQIENGPIPELAEYTRTVEARITTLITEARSSGGCGITRGGASVSAEKATETIDRAFLEIPVFDNTFLDFLYNIQVAINGETRAPVLRDGTIFSTTEQRITRAIANVTNTCSLNGAVRSGFQSLLQENQTLENIYKQTVLGTPIPETTGLSPSNIIVANAITRGYVPTATESCKSQTGIAELTAKLQQSLESVGAKSEGVLSDWKKGIALFQGGGGKMSTLEYTRIQRKLLQSEIARQGFSPRMAETILGNFDCFKGKTIGDDSAEAAILAKRACLSNPILGLETILLPWRKRVDSARTTNARVISVNELSKEQQIKSAIIRTYSNLEAYRTPAIDIKSALMSNLIDIHLGLISTAEQVEKRLPTMYTNCMKSQSSISCPKP
ncbi:hypothetical protein H7169_02470 [Candidatus Gracilibacteria bacterium]|nr:hypothetical protein [Candidatus Gracilibacteria bacterium]